MNIKYVEKVKECMRVIEGMGEGLVLFKTSSIWEKGKIQSFYQYAWIMSE